MILRCKTCKGEYETESGGGKYFHHCPPVLDGATNRWIDQPNARNENIQQNVRVDDILTDSQGKPINLSRATAKSQGLGTEEVQR